MAIAFNQGGVDPIGGFITGFTGMDKYLVERRSKIREQKLAEAFNNEVQGFPGAYYGALNDPLKRQELFQKYPQIMTGIIGSMAKQGRGSGIFGSGRAGSGSPGYSRGDTNSVPRGPTQLNNLFTYMMRGGGSGIDNQGVLSQFGVDPLSNVPQIPVSNNNQPGTQITQDAGGYTSARPRVYSNRNDGYGPLFPKVSYAISDFFSPEYDPNAGVVPQPQPQPQPQQLLGPNIIPPPATSAAPPAVPLNLNSALPSGALSPRAPYVPNYYQLSIPGGPPTPVEDPLVSSILYPRTPTFGAL